MSDQEHRGADPGGTRDGDADPAEPTVHDLVGAYVLDAVDDRERAEFEEHLASCPDCRREVAELADPVVDLSVGLEEEPPEGLRARLLEQIAQEPPAVVPLRGREDDADGELGSAEDSDATTGEAAAAAERRAWWVGIAAAAAVIVGAVAVTQWVTNDVPAPVVVAEDVLEAPDAVRHTETLGDVTVTVVTAASLDSTVFVAEGMEEAPEGQDYQLWFVHEDGTAVSAGLMPRTGADTTEMVLEGESGGAVAVGVTLEPAGGSEQPTSDPLVAVPIEG